MTISTQEKLQILEKHVADLEKQVFKLNKTYENPFPEDHHLDPELIECAKARQLIGHCCARRVPGDYYKWDLETRIANLGGGSIYQLCKCVLFEVKDAPEEDQKFVNVIIQYADKINGAKLLKVISQTLGKKITDASLAKEEDAKKLSGCEHNAMTPVLMKPTKEYSKFKVQIILSERIAALDPPFFWLGGGEVDVKFGIDTRTFVQKFKPVIGDISC